MANIRTVYLDHYCEGVIAEIVHEGKARNVSDAIRRCIVQYADRNESAADAGQLNDTPDPLSHARKHRRADTQVQSAEQAQRRAKVDLRKVLDPQARQAMRVWIETGAHPDQRTIARLPSITVGHCFGADWQRWRDCSVDASRLRDDTPEWKRQQGPLPEPPNPAKTERCEHGNLASEHCVPCDGPVPQ